MSTFINFTLRYRNDSALDFVKGSSWSERLKQHQHQNRKQGHSIGYGLEALDLKEDSYESKPKTEKTASVSKRC